MKRQIKFRTWSKTNGMLDFDTLENAGWDFQMIRMFNEGKLDCELMEFTGLKDKNGKGIYEGDIVKASYRNTPQVVEWIAKYAGFSIGGAMPERPVNSDFTDWEIIGNIYENPELLN